MTTEDISSGLDDLGFNVINAIQLMANRRAPNGQTCVETLPLIFVTLTRNVKSQEIFQLNGLSNIIVKVESYRAQTGLTQYYNCQNFGHVWANCKQPLDVSGAVVATCIGNAPEKRNTESTPSCCDCNLVEGEKPHPASYRGCGHVKGGPQRRSAKRAPKGFSGRACYSLSSPHQNSPMQLHCVKTLNNSNHRHRRQMGKACSTPFSSICHNRKFRNTSDSTRSQFV
jgi:hypothetical protein